MTSTKRTSRPDRNRAKRRFQGSPLQEDLELQKRVEYSKHAILLIKSMLDDIRAAVAYVKREVKGVLQVECDFTPKKGRIHIYLRAFDNRRKHCHIIIAAKEGMLRVVNAVPYGRLWPV